MKLCQAQPGEQNQAESRVLLFMYKYNLEYVDWRKPMIQIVMRKVKIYSIEEYSVI
jgi:hypothetical protein